MVRYLKGYIGEAVQHPLRCPLGVYGRRGAGGEEPDNMNEAAHGDERLVINGPSKE